MKPHEEPTAKELERWRAIRFLRERMDGGNPEGMQEWLDHLPTEELTAMAEREGMTTTIAE